MISYIILILMSYMKSFQLHDYEYQGHDFLYKQMYENRF